MKKISNFIKKETVLCIAVLLAIVSSFIILPDREYIGYIDFKTLAILFCLMSVMAGLQKLGIFQLIAEKMLVRVKSCGQLIGILVLLCFFLGMFITNDVALITFVPFTFTVLRILGEEQERRLVIPIVVLQTIAANLGSMLTPIGNPHNLYLYAKSGLSVGTFLQITLPYTAISLLLILICCFFLGRKEKDMALEVNLSEQMNLVGKGKTLAVYLVLFALCLLEVAKLVSVWIVLAIVLVVMLIMDRKVLRTVDYSLLITFVGFFIFIGNMGRIPAFYDFLQGIVMGNEVLTSVVSSQFISNVPAALLLSGFTDNFKGLILGTNFGGLGTLIASMASLISYKCFVRESKEKGAKGRYFLIFTIANVAFLAVLLAVYALL